MIDLFSVATLPLFIFYFFFFSLHFCAHIASSKWQAAVNIRVLFLEDVCPFSSLCGLSYHSKQSTSGQTVLSKPHGIQVGSGFVGYVRYVSYNVRGIDKHLIVILYMGVTWQLMGGELASDYSLVTATLQIVPIACMVEVGVVES